MSLRKCHLLRMRPFIKNTETNWTMFYKKLKNNTTIIFATNIRITWENHGGLLKILFIKIKNLRVNQNSNYLMGIWLVTKRSFQKNSMIFLSILVQLWLKKIPVIDKSPLSYMHSRINESIFLSPVTPVEIEKLLLTLKDSATGWDEINAMFLKHLWIIWNPLCHVCNMSLEEGTFHSKLKIAYVLPLFKSDEPSHFNNYRPVSLLCILSKVFEKIMYNRVSDFINKLEILYNFQFGFRKKHYTYWLI